MNKLRKAVAAALVMGAGLAGLLPAGAAHAAPDCDADPPPPTCEPPDPTLHDPYGSFQVTRRPDAIRLQGWAEDPDTTGAIDVAVYLDGSFVGAATANLGGHAFDTVVPAGLAARSVCVDALNVGAGSNSSLGCSGWPADPFGSVDDVSRRPGGIRVAGWAVDPDTAASIDVHVYVDASFAGVATANRSRPDVGAAHPGYGDHHGFELVVPGTAGSRQVCVHAINVGSGANNTQLACQNITYPVLPFGFLDSMVQVTDGVVVEGWTIDPDTAASIDVHVYVDASFAGAATANRSRLDVGGAHPGYGDYHGYRLFLAAGPEAHRVCVYAINWGAGTSNPLLGCQGPIPPSGLFVRDTGRHKILLNWRNNTPGASAVAIDRGVGSGGYQEIARVAGNQDYFVDAGLTEGASYRYRVRTITSDGRATPPSNEVTAVPRPKTGTQAVTMWLKSSSTAYYEATVSDPLALTGVASPHAVLTTVENTCGRRIRLYHAGWALDLDAGSSSGAWQGVVVEGVWGAHATVTQTDFPSYCSVRISWIEPA